MYQLFWKVQRWLIASSMPFSSPPTTSYTFPLYKYQRIFPILSIKSQSILGHKKRKRKKTHVLFKMAPKSSPVAVALPLLLIIVIMFTLASANFYEDFDVTWGDGRAKIIDNGELLTLTLDKTSGSGFQSKDEYMFGKIDMQLKLVAGNSAGTVTAYFVSIKLF